MTNGGLLIEAWPLSALWGIDLINNLYLTGTGLQLQLYIGVEVEVPYITYFIL